MKTYEIRYFSEMAQSRALYGEYSSRADALAESKEFAKRVKYSGLDGASKHKLLASIEVC